MQIILKKDQYDPFIDFLKAYSIICVVLAHCLPPIVCDWTAFAVWGSAQVPLFLLVQGFHAYKKRLITRINYGKVFFRIVVPFLTIQLIIIGGLLLIGLKPATCEIESALVEGGKGPGSYYFWIYLQFMFLLPFFAKIFDHFTMKTCLAVFIAICVGFDVLCSYIDMPEKLYRCLAIRYIFLIYLSMEWVKKGVRLSFKNSVLSFVSIFLVLLFYYYNPKLEPLFFDTKWAIHRWPCYFYVSSLLVFLLRYAYNSINKYQRLKVLKKFILEIGRSSYEIYIVQMAIFIFVPIVAEVLIANIFVRFAVAFSFELLLSIVMGVLLRKFVMLPLLKRY